MSLVCKVEVEHNLKESVKEAVRGVGGFEDVIRAGDKVLLKPNFNTADPFPASSDLEFLRAVVEIVHDAGAGEIILGDSSTLAARTRKVMEKLDIFSLEKLEPRVRIINFDEHEWVKKDIPGGKYLKSVSVPRILDEVDRLILLPCLKTHYICKYTGALKLSVGFMRKRQRVRLHIKETEEQVAELNKIINPDLIIMDARKCFITKGPMDGEVREPNLILASKNRVAIDTEGVNIIKSYPGNSLDDINADELLQLKLAKEFKIDSL